MTSHISDELPRLLTGEATRDDVLGAAAHLRECEDCRQELVSAVVAHASLASAQRFAPEIMSALHEPAEVGLSAGTESPAMPDMSAVFAQVRREAAAELPVPVPGRSRRLSRVAVGAVAAGLVVGAGGLALIEHVGSSSPSGRSVALTAFGIGHTGATARITGADSMRITATSLPKLATTQRYEVWLTDAARTRMQPVGWIGTDGKAQLTVPPNLMQSFSAIEVSVQPVDAPSYDYSGVSVLRGSYGA